MYYITEWKLLPKINEIKLYMYYYEKKGKKLPMKELYKITKKINNVNNICGDIIGTWVPAQLDNNYVYEEEIEKIDINGKKIKIKTGKKEVYKLYETNEYLDKNQEKHKILLNGLILKSIKSIFKNNSEWIVLGNNYYILKEKSFKQMCSDKKYVLIYEKLKFDSNIDLDGNIFIGFNLSYQIIYEENLKLNMNNGYKINSGDHFIYKETGQTVEYINQDDKTLEDIIFENDNNETLYGYLQKKNYIEKYKIDKKSKALICYHPNINNPFFKLKLSFAPEMLYISKPDHRLSYLFNVGGNNIHLKKLITYMEKIVIQLEKDFMNINLIKNEENKEYFKALNINERSFVKFNYDKINFEINGNIQEKKIKNIQCHVNNDNLRFFILRDKTSQTIILNITEKIKIFIKSKLILKNYNKEIEFDVIDFNNDIEKVNLKELKYDGGLIFIKYKKDQNYKIIKKYFNNKQIPTQVVSLSTCNNYNNIKKDNFQQYNQENLISNIVLGLFSKMNLQVWNLASSTKSDCFIGLDVSHENGKHLSACVAYIKKSDNTFGSIYYGEQEKGEKIDDKTLTVFLKKVIEEYNNINNKLPNHITIHRDGFLRENEENCIKKFLQQIEYQKIGITMLSVIKKTNRKIFMYDNKNFKSPNKLAFIDNKNNIAYLILTEIKSGQHNKLVSPIKLELKYNKSSLNFNDIVNDIHKLSCLRYHTTNSTKLPITIDSADKQSTSFNRGLLNIHEYYNSNYFP